MRQIVDIRLSHFENDDLNKALHTAPAVPGFIDSDYLKSCINFNDISNITNEICTVSVLKIRDLKIIYQFGGYSAENGVYAENIDISKYIN